MRQVLTRFRDRSDAGATLATKLAQYARRDDVLILALPRGGVPVGFEVSRALEVPLDIFLVRKLGVPGHEELAMGAIASGGVRIVDRQLVAQLGITDAQIEMVTRREQAELERRERIYRGTRPASSAHGKTAILVDDGLATGSSMIAAIAAVRQHDPARVVVAVPAGAPETCDALKGRADEVICAIRPDPFYAVGLWYEDFSQTTDDEVEQLLQAAVVPVREAVSTPPPKRGWL